MREPTSVSRVETLSRPDAANKIFYRCVEDCFEPIMITNRQGRLQYVNPPWTLVYGYSKEEALGQTPRLLRSEFQTEDFYKKMWATILDPQIGFWRGEIVNRAKDGHLVPVLLTITPYRETSGEIVGYMGIAVDLSEQKRMEHQILQQDRLASIGILASGLAHEIGNPLGTIQGRAELLMKFVKGSDLAEKNVGIIISQIERISRLLKSVLRVSRVPDQVQLSSVPLKSVVDEVVTLMSDPLRKAHIETRLKGLDVQVLAEPSHLQQLFLNLVINSLHAIQDQGASSLLEPGEKHFIEISATAERGKVQVSLRDSGCGIPPANLAKLFQPFFTTKPAGKGTGMGLAIVLKLCEEMRSRISVESEGAGRGATFRIEFENPDVL